MYILSPEISLSVIPQSVFKDLDTDTYPDLIRLNDKHREEYWVHNQHARIGEMFPEQDNLFARRTDLAAAETFKAVDTLFLVYKIEKISDELKAQAALGTDDHPLMKMIRMVLDISEYTGDECSAEFISNDLIAFRLWWD